MSDTNIPLRVIEITNTATKEVVFGVHIHSPFEEADAHEVSTDQVVREYLDDFCCNCHFRSNKLNDGPLPEDFSGRVCYVSEDRSSLAEFSISVRRIDTTSKEYTWWMDAIHSDGGWADQLEYARTGRDTRLQPEQVDDAWNNFWKALGTTVMLIALSIFIVGLVHTMVNAFSNDDND